MRQSIPTRSVALALLSFVSIAFGGCAAAPANSSSESEEERAETEQPDDRSKTPPGPGEETSRRTGSGTAASGAPTTTPDDNDALAEESYRARLLRELASHWRVPTTLTSERLAELAGTVSVYVQLDSEGYVRSMQFVDKSTSERFNATIRRALNECQRDGGGRPLPLPEDATARELVLEKGLRLQNWHARNVY